MSKEKVKEVQKLKSQGLSFSEIGAIMNISDTRAWQLFHNDKLAKKREQKRVFSVSMRKKKKE